MHVPINEWMQDIENRISKEREDYTQCFILFCFTDWVSEIQSVNEDIQPLKKKKHINNGKSIQSPQSDAPKLRNQHFSPEVCEGLTEKKNCINLVYVSDN